MSLPEDEPELSSLWSGADLPAPDSLVRASAEPLQAQEAVLPRAAAEGMETQKGKLVRASTGQEAGEGWNAGAQRAL